MEINNLKILLNNAELHYLNGKYTNYVVEVAGIKERVDNCEWSEKTDINPLTLSSILENNLIVCECLELKWDAVGSIEAWKNLQSRFLLLYQRIADSGLKITSHELHLWLNVVHNYLYWSWIKPQTLKRNDAHVEENLLAATRCFHIVLDFFNSSCLDFKSFDTKIIALHLMKLTAENMLFLNYEGIHHIGLMLIEIYLFIVQILIGSCNCSLHNEDIGLLEACANFIQKVVSTRPSFELSLRDHDQEKLNCISHFSFGIHKINSMVGESDITFSFNALIFYGSLCFFKLQQYKESLSLLSRTSLKNDKLSIILKYLKSYIYYKLDDYKLSYMVLSNILNITLDNNTRARCLLLHSLILLKEGQFLKAQNEIRKVQTIETYLPLALYYTTVVYESFAQTQPREGEITIQSGDQSQHNTKRSRLSIPIGKLHILALTALVQSLEKRDLADNTTRTSSESLELRLLLEIHPQPEPTLLQALYLLARAFAKCGQFLDSADKLLYILSCEPMNESKKIRISEYPPLPSIKILMHETLAVLIQGGRFEDARIICERCLSECDSSTNKLIPNMFLVKIEEHEKNLEDALIILEKCLVHANKMIANNSIKVVAIESEFENEEVLNCLISKLYLQQALIHISQKSISAAEKNLKLALSYNKVDKDALYHLLLVTKHQTAYSKNVWGRHENTFKNVDKKYFNLALDYFLKHNVTTEQVEELSIDFLTCDLVSFDDLFEVMEED